MQDPNSCEQVLDLIIMEKIPNPVVPCDDCKDFCQQRCQIQAKIWKQIEKIAGDYFGKYV
jgi:hypothetical protein